MLTDLRTPSQPNIRVRAIALPDDAADLRASVWPMVTFVGAMLLSLALISAVAG